MLLEVKVVIAPVPSPVTANPVTIKKSPGSIPLGFEGDKELANGIVIPLFENSASAMYGSDLKDDNVPTRYIRILWFLAKYPPIRRACR
jgi:hypothetical protein